MKATLKKFYPVLTTILFFVALELLLAGINIVYPWDHKIKLVGRRDRTFWGATGDHRPGFCLRDPDLFWVYKPGEIKGWVYINSLGFRGREINPEKAPDAIRIATFGNSCTFGGVWSDADVYPEVLEKKLRDLHPERSIEVINAGAEGYTIHQMLSLWRKKVRDLHPDLVTVYAAINDVLYAPMAEDKSIRMSPIGCKITNTLLNFRTGQALFSIIRAVGKRLQGDQFITPYDESKGLMKRVSPEDYRANLEQMIKETRQENVKIVFLTSPLRSGIPTNYFPTPELIRDGDKVKALWIMESAVTPRWLQQIDQSKDYQQELALALDSIAQHPTWTANYFKAGLCYEKLLDTLRAKEYLAKSDSLDWQRKIVREYNQIMREVAQEQNVPLLDLEANFDTRDNFSLFVPDGYHPSGKGHAFIAAELGLVVEELLGLQRK